MVLIVVRLLHGFFVRIKVQRPDLQTRHADRERTLALVALKPNALPDKMDGGQLTSQRTGMSMTTLLPCLRLRWPPKTNEFLHKRVFEGRRRRMKELRDVLHAGGLGRCPSNRAGHQLDQQR